jgi:glycosyltransferase involved in cell wall biosynthesis
LKERSESPLVSIIIPTFNSGRTIGICLESIIKQTYREIEIIVVDNYSSDNTVKMAKSFNSKVIISSSERSAARNLGAKLAKGEYLLFIDSDMKLTKNVVKQCVEKAIKERFDAIIIQKYRKGKA